MKTSNELKAIMAQCYGTEHYYKDVLLSFRFTDGVKTFAENAGENGAFWFIQEVNGMIIDKKIRQSKDDMTDIHLVVNDGKADIVMTNDGKTYRKHIAYTDVQNGDWLFYYFTGDNVLIWNDEY